LIRSALYLAYSLYLELHSLYHIGQQRRRRGEASELGLLCRPSAVEMEEKRAVGEKQVVLAHASLMA
jgi:hypothetical protein